MRLIHNSWVEVRKSKRYSARVTMRMDKTSARLVARKKRMVFLMLEKMCRPSRTAVTMVEKLSSAMTMSAAFLVTSVPAMPMAMPISARRMPGASLMPSPVMATTSPAACSRSTIRLLCRGVTRANTRVLRMRASNSLSGSASSCAPVNTSRSEAAMPRREAMANAVSRWSPVIMTVRMPACAHSSTASRAPARGGSIMPHRPRKTSSSSSTSPVNGR